MLVIFAIEFVIGFILGLLGLKEGSVLYGLVQLGSSVITMIASVGYISYIYKLLDGKEIDVKEALLSKFNMWGVIIVTFILVYVFTVLWSVLLIIPGIIYAFSMAMVYYILAEDGAENMTSKEVRQRSKGLMNGHKMEYFIFSLSFIGWELLVGITAGIAIIWVYPYMIIANIMFYKELAGKNTVNTTVEVPVEPVVTPVQPQVVTPNEYANIVNELVQPDESTENIE